MRAISQNARALLAAALKRKAPPEQGGAEQKAGITKEDINIMLQTKERNAEAAEQPLFSAAQKPADVARFETRLANLIRFGEPQFMHIEPWQAEIMLARNTRNRNLRPSHVAFLAGEINKGAWRITGQPIIFNAEGSLQDGQHRLAACVEAGRSIQTLVVFRVDPAAYVATDIGIKRTTGDMLHHEGVTDYNRVAAAARMVIQYDTGNMAQPKGRAASPEAIVAWVKENSALMTAATLAGGRVYQHGRLLGASTAAALYFILSRIDQRKADEFFERLATGLGLSGPNDPIARLRDRLIHNATSRAKLGSADLLALSIKAWNAFRAGRSLGLVRYARDEEFPVAV